MKKLRKLLTLIMLREVKVESIKMFLDFLNLQSWKKFESTAHLNLGRSVGIEEEDDGEPFGNKMGRHTLELAGPFKKSKGLDEKIGKNL